MELKLFTEHQPRFRRLGSNRTFMELKLTWLINTKDNYFVLIVPLWNWNTSTVSITTKGGTVLIVPLWNWNKCIKNRNGLIVCSNRTFMELKYEINHTYHLGKKVLIVPLWNWNDYSDTAKTECSSSNRTFMELKSQKELAERLSVKVLIVPLWNWNLYAT